MYLYILYLRLLPLIGSEHLVSIRVELLASFLAPISGSHVILSFHSILHLDGDGNCEQTIYLPHSLKSPSIG